MGFTSLQNPYVLDEDEEDVKGRPGDQASSPINLYDDEETDDDIEELEELYRNTRHIQLSDNADDNDDTPIFMRETAPRLHMNELANRPTSIFNEAGVQLSIGEDWELHNGDFFYIERFVSDGRQTLAEGELFRRTKYADRMLPKKRNELYMFVTMDQKGNLLPNTMSLSAFVMKREIVRTNANFPLYSYRLMLPTKTVSSKASEVIRSIEEGARLVCRWKRVERIDDSGNQAVVVEEGVVGLREEDADVGKSVSDVKRWQHHHYTVTPTSLAGSKRGRGNHNSGDAKREENDEDDWVMIDHHHQNSGKNKAKEMMDKAKDRKERSPKVRALFSASPTSTARRFQIPSLSFGDICAGAGGVSCGAKQAGLDIKYQLDNDHAVCRTLKMNFTSEVLERDVYDFIELAKRSPARYRVAVLHLSLPCQYFSAAHTVQGKNDDRNILTNLCVEEMLAAVRPRIVTFEQAPGILWRDGGIFFETLIRALTSNGYSVKWRKLNLAEYGNYQARKRLILIAAAPGEIVPDFPEPTHAAAADPRAGIKAFPYIQDALATAASWFARCPANMRLATPKNEKPYSAMTPLRHCITTNGGESDVHPSGKRTFTLHELALLQAFPPWHLFYGGLCAVRRQIGNAVPSCFAETLFKKVIESLKRSDRIAGAAQSEKETITIDD